MSIDVAETMHLFLKQSSAWLALAISLAALVLLFVYVAMFGAVQPQAGAVAETVPIGLIQFLERYALVRGRETLAHLRGGNSWGREVSFHVSPSL